MTTTNTPAQIAELDHIALGRELRDLLVCYPAVENAEIVVKLIEGPDDFKFCYNRHREITTWGRVNASDPSIAVVKRSQSATFL